MKAHDSRRAGKSLLKTVIALVLAGLVWFAQKQGLIPTDGDTDSNPQVSEAPADRKESSPPTSTNPSGSNRAPAKAPSHSSDRNDTPTTSEASTPASDQADPWGGKNDAKLVQQSQRYGRNGVEVELPVRVVHLLPDDTDETPHQNFLAETSLGQTLKISHNTKLAPYVPIEKGDMVRVKGDFETNSKGGVVHWTHWDPRGRHTPGWIEHKGKRYGKLEGSR